MTQSDTPSSPLAALVAIAFISGVVGSLWWNTREDAGGGVIPEAGTAQTAAGSAAPRTPRAAKP